MPTFTIYTCPNCHYESYSYGNGYCPLCGAKLNPEQVIEQD